MWKDIPGGTKASRLVMPIHDGSIGGLLGRIIATLSSLLGVLFRISGVIMWYPKWKLRRKRNQPSRVQKK